MTDPERLSRRTAGLAAELVRAGKGERPDERGMQQTLLALGLSGVVLSSTSAAGAAAVASSPLSSAVSASTAGGVGLTSASTLKTATAALVVKWLGIGMVGGVGFLSVASVATRPASKPSTPSAAVGTTPARAPDPSRAAAMLAPRTPQPVVGETPASEAAASAVPLAPRASVVELRASAPTPDVGALLAAEVAYVDRARALLAAGQVSQGLSLLEAYEQKFHEARLVPEVLFLQLEAYERAGRSSAAQGVARRLVNGFPNSPHAGRARKLLAE